MQITSLYAALGALLVIILASRVMLRRNSRGIGIGDGDDSDLRKRIRAHANAVEYLPLGLILLGLLEWNQFAPTCVHAFGATLLGGRVLHAIGMSRSSGRTFERVLGMVLTLLALLGMAMLLLWEHLAASAG